MSAASPHTPASDPAGTLTARTVAGLRWSYFAAGVSAVLQTVYVASMSRLLSPRDFGLMAIATLAVNFGFFFARMGMAQALIQKPELTEDDARAGATSGFILGLLCWLALWFIAPLLGDFFNSPESVPLLRALGATFVLSGMAITSQGLLRRALRFKALALISIANSMTILLVGLSLAILGLGVWSLVWAALAAAFTQWALQFACARHSMRPILRLHQFRGLYAFGARASMLRLLEFLGKNLDTFAVGRFATTAILGQYNRAFYLVNLPISKYLAMALSTVLFPSFSRIQDDHQRLVRAFRTVMGLSALILFPICVGMAVAAPDVVRVALGEQWDRAIVLVPWFAIAAALNILSKLSELLFEARAELNKTIALQSASLVILVLLLWAATLVSDPWAFAAALMIAEFIRHTAYAWLLRRVMGFSFSNLWSAYLPGLSAAMVVATAILTTRLLVLQTGAPVVVVLAADVAAGAVSLALSIRWMPFPRMRRDLRQRIRSASLTSPRRPWLRRMVGLLLGHDAPSMATDAS